MWAGKDIDQDEESPIDANACRYINYEHPSQLSTSKLGARAGRKMLSSMYGSGLQLAPRISRAPPAGR